MAPVGGRPRWPPSISPFAMTTVSHLLPPMIKPIGGLPNELMEMILYLLPLSAIIELSMVEARVLHLTGENRATGPIASCIMDSLGWRPVFPDVDALFNIRFLYRYALEAFVLVYRQKFNHSYIGREDKNRYVNTVCFRALRQILPFHSRTFGFYEPDDLYLHFEDRLFDFIEESWKSIKDLWNICDDSWTASQLRKPDYIEDGPYPHDLRQEQLRWMVRTLRAYEGRYAEELNRLSSLLKEYPLFLRQINDGREQPRPNITHIATRLEQDALRMSYGHFAAKKQSIGRRYFQNERLALVPLDKWMWFFLECRSICGGSIPDSRHTSQTLPWQVAEDMVIVMRHICYIQQWIPHESTSKPTPRLVTRTQNREEPNPILPSTIQLNFQIDSCTYLRPKFTAPRSDHPDISKPTQVPKFQRYKHHFRRRNSANVGHYYPHDTRELDWLEAFLRCCAYFVRKYPELWAKVEKEASRIYQPCEIAEMRLLQLQKKRMQDHVAGELSLRSAKYDLLGWK
ncbi:hypothetical protein EJ08DRAFT_697694 [Tothia fuscella]|uniref:F-box domain-containing protein n=1 Tax=Tothia fuscella TaxID=1048955 RepID=A0A9P4NR67_9PEZI|nr:hypothetical protein EJ08DRAFT_697694 [Tothia fuscella]